jgi:hypothetical protein
MAPHLEDRLLIPSHIFLPTSVVIPALPMHMDSRKKLGIESWNSKIRWCTYLEDEVGLQEFGIWNGWEIFRDMAFFGGCSALAENFFGI